MIKAIVFDFGNVLYDLDFNLFNQNLSALLDEDISNGYPQFLVDTVLKYDAGQINTETFIWHIQKYKNGLLNHRSIINCWNSLLKGFPPENWDFLEKIKTDYKLYLLSNINELHLDTVYKHIKKVHGRVDFETKYFEAVFYSHLLKMIKPNKEIYTFVQNMIGFDASEILFIDDKIENVTSAQKIGWNAVLHDPSKPIEQSFNQYIEQFI